MKTTLSIAADSIRALLRQRLLLGLMLLALALIAIFSAVMIAQRKMMTLTAIDASTAEVSTKENAPGKPTTEAPVVQVQIKTRRDTSVMSPEDRKALAENLEQMESMYQALFYQVASFGGSLVSLFIFSTAVAAEIRRGTIRITLTKPVSRSQYLLGKYLGGVAVMAGYACLASIAILLFAKFGEFQLSPAMKFAPWLMFCRQLMLGSVAMLLSLFVHPFVGAVLAFFTGNEFYGRFNPLFYLLPSYDAFNLFREMVQGTLVSGRDVMMLSFYALDFVILILACALWRFRSKELV